MFDVKAYGVARQPRSLAAAPEVSTLPVCAGAHAHSLRPFLQPAGVREVHSSGGGGDDLTPRPLAQDPQVRHAVAAAEQRRTRRSGGSHDALLSSVNDPEHYGLSSSWPSGPAYWLGSSMSSSEYQMPSSLRTTCRSALPSQVQLLS